MDLSGKLLWCLFRAFPLLVWHRQNWSIVHPYVHLEEEELGRLTTSITYVAGFTDASVESRTELYDLFVNGKCVMSLSMSLYIMQYPLNFGLSIYNI